MLVLRPRRDCTFGLRFSYFDLGACGSDVSECDRIAGVELVLHNIERFAILYCGALQKIDQRICRPHIEVGRGQHCLRRELGIVEIGLGGLRRRRVAFDLTADLAPHVDVPGRAELRIESGRVDRADAPYAGEAGLVADGFRAGIGAGESVCAG